MSKPSAGLLMYRTRESELDVFLVHPGGPFFSRRDEGAWTIPKGEIEGDEDPLETARREFEEEVGTRPEGPFQELGEIRQKGGKIVRAWAFEVQPDQDIELNSNTFEMEWPPHSGRRQAFPEVDRGEFFELQEARRKLSEAQHAFLDRLHSLTVA